MAYLESLQTASREIAAQAADPWRVRLERLRGKVDYDCVERISSQAVLDVLNVSQRSRTAGACRRLAKLMRELGWAPVRVRDFNGRGFKEQIRGYAREAQRAPQS